MANFLTTYASFTDKLSHIGADLSVLDNVGTELLSRVERELEWAEGRDRLLRRFEEEVRRFLRRLSIADTRCSRDEASIAGGEGEGGSKRREAIQRCRETYMPFLREVVGELNLARGRVGILEVAIRRWRLKGHRGVRLQGYTLETGIDCSM